MMALLWSQFLTSTLKPEWLQTIAAVSTLVVTTGLAIITWWYVRLTSQQVKANILTPLMVEYGSPEMGNAIRQVRRWQCQYGENHHAQAFENALSTVDPSELARYQVDRTDAVALDIGPRRMLSQYFYRIRAVCEHGLVGTTLIARALGPEPIALYLEIIDPLDQAQRRALHRPRTRKTREFFERLRQLAPEE